MYIKLDKAMNLIITVNDSLYRGDNLNRKIIYLLPLSVGEIDLATANVYLNYVRDGCDPDIVLLERLEEKYNESYYQYTFPVTCKLTNIPGDICTWLQIITGDMSNPTISKSGECTLNIKESKDMDDYLSDNQITAIYQLQKTMEGEVAGLDDNIAKLNEDLGNKADDIIYDDSENYLQLSANGSPIGDQIDMDDVRVVPAPKIATVGQVVRVAEVDEGGKPIKWEAVDFPNEYTLPPMTGTALGGAMADAAQEGDTQPVRIGADHKLYTAMVEEAVGEDAIEALAECEIVVPAYQDGVFYTDMNGTIYTL